MAGTVWVVAISLAVCAAGCKDKKPPVAPTAPASTAPVPANQAAAPYKPQLTPLASCDIQPTDGPRTLAADGGRIKVTVPASVVKGPAKLTISAVANPPAQNNDLLQQGSVYDISLGDLHALDKEIAIEMPIPQGASPKNCPPEVACTAAYYEPSMGVWIDLPCEVNAKTNTMTIRTDHLCLVCVKRVGESTTITWDEGPIRFAILYNRASVVAAKGSYGDKGDDSDPIIPRYIVDVLDCLRTAVKKYGERGFRPANRFMMVYVSGMGNPTHYGLTGNLQIPFLYDTKNDMQRAVAHELFHNCQRSFYRLDMVVMHRWWMETTAEFAASRLAMDDFARMGKTDSPMPPYFLRAPITRVHAAGDEYPSHEEQGSQFIDFVSRSCAIQKEKPVDYRLFFTGMFQAVAPSNTVQALGYDLPRIEQFISSEVPGTTINAVYDQFALHYLFNQASPMTAADKTKVPPQAAQEHWPLSLGDPVKSFAFTMEPGLSAQVSAIRVSPPVARNSLSLECRATAAPKDTSVLAYLLPNGTREIDTHMFWRGLGPHCTDITAKPTTLEVGSDDALYIVAINHSTGTANVSAEVASIVPADNGHWRLAEMKNKPLKNTPGEGGKVAFTSVAGAVTGGYIADYTFKGKPVHKETKGKITFGPLPDKISGTSPTITFKVACELEGDLDKANSSQAMDFTVNGDMIEIKPAWRKIGADATKKSATETFVIKFPPVYPAKGQSVHLPVSLVIRMPFAGSDTFIYDYEWVPPGKP